MSAVESLGKYVIKRQLGRGAMGVVYEGFDPVIERVVAIKTVRLPEAGDDETAEEIARFRREAQAAGRLSHPNIVGVFDYGETADIAYIVMEYVDGPPLKNLMDKHERFPLPRIVHIMEDLLAGLQFSHERGVVHRDIKPANLMLTQGGQAKIADFGIARIESSSMTQAGTVLGTPAYMSPEQFMGQVVDARSDIYSSGVLLYQLLTGERPFEGSMSAIMHKALNTEAPLPSEISVTAPRPFDAVVRRAMAKRPEDRFASASDFMAAIRAAATAPAAQPADEEDNGEATMISTPRSAAAKAGATGIARPPPRPPERAVAAAAVPAKSSKLPMILGGSGAGFVILAGVGYFLISGGGTPKPTPQDPPRPITQLTPPVEPAHPDTVTPPVQPIDVAPPPVKPVEITPTVKPDVTPPVKPVELTPPVKPIEGTQVVAVVPPRILPAVNPDDAMRAEVASFVSQLPCALLDGGIKDGVAQITGLGAKTAIDAIRQKLGLAGLARPAPSLRITQIDPVFCTWIDLLRPIAGNFGDGTARLGLRLADDPAWLVKDNLIRPRLTMAGFRGELHVDYIDRTGHVLHLFPQPVDPKLPASLEPARVFGPGDQLSLGDRDHGDPFWLVDEPYGTDMIIAIASEDALFDRPRTENIEKAAVYLRDLKRALDSAKLRKTQITAAAMPVETRRK